MKTRFIPALVALLAATAVSIINIVNKTELIPGLRNLLITTLGFYILGSIGKSIINHAIYKKKTEDQSEITDTLSSEEASTVDLGTNDKTDEFVK